MSDERWRLETAPGFEAGLRRIADFLEEAGFPQVMDRLLDELETTVFPNLCRFPRMGRRFPPPGLAVPETRYAVERLNLSIDQELREYLHRDYLVLYAVLPDMRCLVLLSIRHGRQFGHG